MENADHVAVETTLLASYTEERPDESIRGGLSRRTDQSSFPVSYLQKRFWIDEQSQPGTSVNHVRLCFRLKGNLDVHALEVGLTEVLKRHEVLRGRFSDVDGLPVQRIAPVEPVVTPLIDFAHRPDAVREQEALAVATIESERPFDRLTGALFRSTLFRLSSDDHLLLLTIHRMVFDEGSVPILFCELAAAYSATSKGRPLPMPDESEIQYADFAAWTDDQSRQRQVGVQLEYWLRRLAGVTTRVDLPFDRPCPLKRTFNGAQVTLDLPRLLGESLTTVARQRQATLFMVLFAAFRVLLSRHTGQPDILVGTPVHGRSRAQLEALIGCFVNTLVLRIPIDEDISFIELLDAVRAEVLQAFDNQDVAFERLVEELQPERDLNRPALVQVQFAFQSKAERGFKLDAVSVTPVPLTVTTTRFELALDVFETSSGLTCLFQYNTDLFAKETVMRLMANFERLLVSIVDHPTAKLSELDTMSESERARIVVDWNRTQALYPERACIHELIESQASRTPNRVAVEFQDQRLSYAELDERSTQLANYLRRFGLPVESLVGVCLERSLEMVVAVLAVMKAGAAYVPLDPSFPPERLNYMLKDAGASVLVTEQDQLWRFANFSGSTVVMDNCAAAIARESSVLPASGVSSENLAYVIYTSGSTGEPKGVMITHRSAVNFLVSMREEPGLTDEDSLLAVTTLSFDIAVLEIFLPLIVGARVIVASRETAMNGSRLAAELVSRKATVMQATPATWRLLIESGWSGNKVLKALCGGEAMSRDLADVLLLRSASVWNMYGPTETTVWSLIAKVQSSSGPVPIGRPIANTTVYVLDAYNRPTPVGITGELYVGGDSLARGYRNHPALTAQKFIPNPLTERCGERIYNTGDLARYRDDGQLEYRGRLDGQVKINGCRIEPGEVEAVLRRHPSVREAVVVVRGNAAGDNRLLAYMLAMDPVPPPSSEIRRHAANLLPPYMVPVSFVFLDALPMTPNGKIDRNSLPAPEVAGAPRETTQPQTPLESTLLRIFKDVLGDVAVGVTDNFFDLGGHSVLTARLITRIEKKTGHNVPVATLFQAPTVRLLAQKLQNGGYSASPLVVLRKSNGAAAEPLFCIHWHGAKLVTFQKLASMLRNDRPVYGLHPNGIDGREDSVQSIAGMAEAYVREIRAIHPHGPYHLAGSCLGGVVAFEIAQQLVKGGEQVGLLLLIDAYLPGKLEYLHDRPPLAEYLDWYLGEFMLSPIGALKRWRDDWIPRLAIHRRCSLGSLTRVSDRFRKMNVKAAAIYHPESYPGKITLLMCSDAPFRSYEDRRLAWNSVAGGGLEIHVVPGNHVTMEREPNIRVIGELFQRCFDRLNHSPSRPDHRTRESVPPTADPKQTEARLFHSAGSIRMLPNDCA